MSITRTVFGFAFFVSTLTALATGCSSEDSSCLRDADCGSGRRCIGAVGRSRGQCEACDANETPYDGIDNDCNFATPDSDLDNDGDNFVSAATNPGTDCNDENPDMSGLLAEACDDGLDNNCDGRVDEPACSDIEAPFVEFIEPVSGSLVAGTVDVRVRATDNFNLVRVRLEANGPDGTMTLLDTTEITGSEFDAVFDSATGSDGQVVFRAHAFDEANRMTSVTSTVFVDNASGPRLELGSIVQDGVYGGMLVAEILAEDAVGVAEIALTIDGMPAGAPVSLDDSRYRFEVDTRSFEDGPHTVEVTATDGGDQSSSDSATVVFDNLPPIFEFVKPEAMDEISETFEVAFAATDSTFANIVFMGQTNSRPNATFNLDTSTLPNGPVTLTATAADQAIVDGVPGGNRTVATVDVVVVNQIDAPIIEFLSPTNGSQVAGRTKMEVAVTAPMGRRVQRVEFAVNGVAIEEKNQEPWETSFPFAKDGLQTLRARAWDSKEAVSSATITVQVQNSAVLRYTPTLKVLGVGGATRPQIDADDADKDGVGDFVVSGSPSTLHFGQLDADANWIPDTQKVLDLPGKASDIELYDIDDDGWLDIVAVTEEAFHVILSAGSPRQYGTATAYTVPKELGILTELAAADFDKDGHPDIVVGGQTTVGMVYFGDRGLFDTADPERSEPLLGVANVTDLVAVDVNDDDRPDIAVGRSRSRIFTMFVNRGGTTVFGAGVDTPTEGEPLFLAFGDLNGDQRVDAITAEKEQGSRDGVGTYLSDAAYPPGAFVAEFFGSTQETSSGIDVQLDANGNVERVYVGTEKMNGFEVWANDAQGLVHESAWVMARKARYPTVFDLDDDGDLDMLMVGTQDDVVAYSENIGRDQFFAIYNRTVRGNLMRATAFGDITGDGRMDVATNAAYTEFFQEIDNLLVRFPIPELEDENFAAGAMGDFDGVNGPDFAFFRSRNPVLMLNDGVGGFSPAALDDTVPEVSGIRVGTSGDVDQDGKVEYVATSGLVMQPGDIWVLETNGSTVSLDYRRTVGESPQQVFVADIDGDGAVDVGSTNIGSEDVSFIRSIPGSILQPVLYNALADLQWVTVDRFGSDQRPDIAGVAERNGFFFMEGDTISGFQVPRSFEAGILRPVVIDSGDYNGDGITDAFVANKDRQGAIIQGRAVGGVADFFPGLDIPMAGLPLEARSADINDDGREDVLITVGDSPSILVIFSDADQY